MEKTDPSSYKGEKLKNSVEVTSNNRKETLHAYFPHPDLIMAVKIARIVNRPLLITGDPGCGKSRLAEAIAYELYEKNYGDYYFPWYINSKSKVIDGIRYYDYFRRLADANTPDQLKEPNEYCALMPLAKAFVYSKTKPETVPAKDEPCILLIDEIDKADIDFPNDLLYELEKKEFLIPELKEGEQPIRLENNRRPNPIIIITSNNEKELPKAFLRRCVYFHLTFPINDDDSIKTLNDIVEARLTWENGKEDHKGLTKEHTKLAIKYFFEIRNIIIQGGFPDKVPGISELLDWIVALNYLFKDMSEDKKKAFKVDPALLGTLVKSSDDLLNVSKKIDGKLTR